ncbi:MAG: DUF1849 family protein [Beijerinckiaceae bacterium]|nr:DUF1849 family protein [Beijerinckiaceae bacterium]
MKRITPRLSVATLLVPLLAASPAVGQGVPPSGVQLQPHRIAYEISLGARSGSALTAASGLMALEFTGNRCDGFVTNFRQATMLADSDGQSRNLDFRVNLWEEGAGKRFRFTVKNDVNGQTTRDADGEAQRVRDGSVSVAMKKPRGKKGDFDGNILFPSAMMIQLVEAALKGERRYEARLFDGSEGGEKVFETVASIGPKLEGDRNRRLEPALQVSSLDKVPRWPVSMAYFDGGPGDRVPVYTMKSVTFANGVVSDLLFEFPEFSLAAKAVRYEPLPEEACTR